MAYRRDRRFDRSIRDAYEEHFPSSREVTVQRVVNIVEKRTPMNRGGYDEDLSYGGPRTHQDTRGAYPANHHGYPDDYANDDISCSQAPYSSNTVLEEVQYSSNRDDGHLRRVEIRNSGRGNPYYRSRGRGRGSDHKFPHTDRGEDHDYRPRRESYTSGRERSPIRREVEPPFRREVERSPIRREVEPPIRREVESSPIQKEIEPPIPVRTGPKSTSRSRSPEKDKSFTYQQLQQRRYDAGHNREHDKSSTSSTTTTSSTKKTSSTSSSSKTSHTSRDSVEVSPARSSVSSKENPPSSVTELEEAEPELTPEEDFKTRRAQAIAAKAVEIEKLYRQDCETFGRVVKMLVAKEPGLDELLQGPLSDNLLEIKQRCLDDLRHFIKELDQVLQLPETST